MALPLKGGKKVIGPNDIQEALTKAQGNKAKAARILGIGRVILYRKLKEFNL
jgi:transcriptional regulator of acetoin/glycerol metabolism